MDNNASTAASTLNDSLTGKYPGLTPKDLHSGNVSLTQEGNLISHDGGTMVAKSGYPPIRRYSPDVPMARSMADAHDLGGPAAIQEMMRRGSAAGTIGQGVSGIPGLGDLSGMGNDQQLVKDFLGKYGNLAGARTPEISTAPSFAAPPAGGRGGFPGSSVQTESQFLQWLADDGHADDLLQRWTPGSPAEHAQAAALKSTAGGLLQNYGG
jgi:hypothetical protein